jgi:hypothetical protein
VADNERLYYTKREVAQAKEAIRLRAQLGYPSDTDLLNMIRSGSIMNCTVTAHDVLRAITIYGKDIASLKGKTNLRKGPIAKVEHVPRPLVSSLVLHIDLFFVDKEPYIMSVSEPLGMNIVTFLHGTKNAAAIWKAVRKHVINMNKVENFAVSTILCDSKGGVSASKTNIEEFGIKLMMVASGTHVPRAERRIRVIKERVRCIINTLPYTLPRFLLRWAVFYAVNRINMMPSHIRVDNLPPIECFRDRKIDYKRDLRGASFGEYGQAVRPNILNRNGLEPRTEGVIVLLPVGNLHGSVKYFALETQGIITRDQCVYLPMPDEAIRRMNDIAAATGRSSNTPPVFQIAGAQAPVVEDDQTDRAVPVSIVVDDRIREAYKIPTKYSGSGAGDSIIMEPEVTGEDTKIIVDSLSQPQLDPSSAPINVDNDDNNDEKDNVITHNDISSRHGESNDVAEDDDDDDGDDDDDDDDDDAGSDSQDDVAEEEVVVEQQEAVRSNEGRYDLRPRSVYKRAYITLKKEVYYHTGTWKQAFFNNVSIKSALEKYPKAATDAITAEVKQMLENKVWRPINTRAPGFRRPRRPIRSFMFLKEKYHPSGKFDKIKARLVAGGHMQDRKIYENISSSTIAYASVCMVVAIAAAEDRFCITLDITGAYLNASMDGEEEVYMYLDKEVVSFVIMLDPTSYADYIDEQGRILVALLRALYRCIESALLWFKHICATLLALGYTQNPVDRCVFNKMVSIENG